jgi:hypothetical protein
MRRAVAIAALALAAALVPATPAFGHAFYVQVGGTGSGDECDDPATPCDSITEALAVADDIILVAPGTYPEAIDVPAGKTVIAQGVPTQGSHVISHAGPGATAIATGTTSDPARIVGFTVQGPKPVVLNGVAQLSNSFLSDAAVPDDEAQVRIEGTGNGTVEGNTFGDDGAGRQIAVEAASAGAPLIFGNTISGFWRGVEVTSGNPTLRGNAISGAHDDAGEGAGVHVAGAVAGAAATLSANTIGAPGAGTPAGVSVDGTGGPTAATLGRNRLFDLDPAVRATDATSLGLDSDLIAGGGVGIVADGTPVAAANLTAFDTGVRELSLLDSELTLASSVVEHPIQASGSSSCSISHSAGPTTGGGQCEAFQLSAAAPGFADPGAGDYRLTAGSPLVDTGDPGAPAEGALDLNGDPRAVAGTFGGAERRDVGADELVPECAAPSPDLPGPGPVPGPSPPRDTDPPASKVDKLKLDGRAALLRFSADEPVAGFGCRLDGGDWKPCTSPKRYRRLDRGKHIFRVRSMDLAGNLEAGSARERFRVR